jgi:two-component system, NarL family, response regulator DevR
MSHNVLASVLVIDDHPVVRIGIIKALTAAGFNCVGQAGSLKEAIAMIALHNPRVITVDINLPDGNGLEIVQWARKRSPSLIIIVLSLNDELDLISAAAKAGAQGFISKSAGIDLLIAAIQTALVNPTTFTSDRAIELLMREKNGTILSPREITVITYLAGEMSISDIAKTMFISHSTAKTHITTIYRKLDTHSRPAAVARAKSLGLI